MRRNTYAHVKSVKLRKPRTSRRAVQEKNLQNGCSHHARQVGQNDAKNSMRAVHHRSLRSAVHSHIIIRDQVERLTNSTSSLSPILARLTHVKNYIFFPSLLVGPARRILNDALHLSITSTFKNHNFKSDVL